ncbi:MATE family efflux transporter [Cellulosilyticum sp. WCF-2]|uniref:MATE family efflux transporter n=1 Tax=Cellulosilyticum sp. WCF-2 TaxID=2497860 RepID=UPI000F8D2A92|nr:MATE family efflux transporter [Cellulosilyticum sp. WCF-2]QEH67113.1 MATE family efflux transporter [Cellulosilyticum sp. WCF-2]
MTATLTKGNETKALLLFSIPMILGNMLQQLYNVVDTLIVGRTLGPNALAAVGASYALMVLLTSIILGLCMGSGVVFAQLFGAGRIEELKISIVNAFVLICVLTLIIDLVAFLLLDQLVVWLNVPVEAMSYMIDYLRIIFLGMGFVFIYNFFAAVLRSIGNTMVPLLFLGISAIINVVLDIVLIVNFGMGIEGAAVATVVAQGVSAVLIAIYFFKKAESICPRRNHMRYDKKLLGLVINNSILTSIQQSIMNFGILMIQGLVNSFGVTVTAAFAIVVKIDAFAYMPAQDFGNAFATFVAQNAGAKEHKRIYKGTLAAAKLSIAFCAIASLLVCYFAKPLMLLFVEPKEMEIIRLGMQYLHIEGACYIGIGILFLLYGFYRGLGKSQMSIILTVFSLGTRVILAYLLAPIPEVGLLGIWWAIPIGWVIADIIGILYGVVKKEELLVIEHLEEYM